MRAIGIGALALGLWLGPCGAGAAQECPPAPEIAAEVAAILAEVRAAPDAFSARPLTDRLWRLWTRAPDAQAQAMLDRGMQLRSWQDLDGAGEAFDALIAYCPGYAEGYNQRAFLSFLRGDYGAALEDVERALERNPEHVAAMTGQAVTLMRLGRMKAAGSVLREALRRHPWLPERGLLPSLPAED